MSATARMFCCGKINPAAAVTVKTAKAAPIRKTKRKITFKWGSYKSGYAYNGVIP